MSNAIYQKARQKMLNPRSHLLVTGATNATPIVLTTDVPHGLATSDVVFVRNVGGTTAANATWTITSTGASTFSLQTSVGNGAYTAATGEVYLTDLLLKKMSQIIRWGSGSSGGGNRAYGDDIRACFVNTSGAGTLYSPDTAQDEFLSSIPGAAIIATSSIFTTKTNSTGSGGSFLGGIADMDDLTFTSVGPAGTTLEVIVVYKDTGTAATSPLICIIDTATGLPFTANGSDIQVTIDAGANRLFAT